MGQLIQLRKVEPNAKVIKALRLLLHRAKTEGITGFAFVALKPATVCYGVVNIDDRIAALDAAETLVEKIETTNGVFCISNLDN